MKTVEYLDAVKRKLDLQSDYSLKDPLGVKPQTISRYRRGLDTFGEDMAIKVAGILKIKPQAVLADMAAERSKSPEAESAWRAVSEKFSGAFRRLASDADPRYPQMM